MVASLAGAGAALYYLPEMRPTSIVVIRAPGELSRLADAGARALRRRTVVLELAGLAPAETDRWERRLNRETRACGCDTGAAGLFIGMALLAIYTFYRNPFLLAPARAGVAAAVFVVALAMVGKAVGLFAARRRLVGALRELHHQLEGRAPWRHAGAPSGDPRGGTAR